MQKAWPVKKIEMLQDTGKTQIAFAMIFHLILSVAAFGYSQYSAITSISHDDKQPGYGRCSSRSHVQDTD